MKTNICICSILVLLLLSSCGSGTATPTVTPVDVSAIQTSIVETVVAAATQTVEAYSPTPEPTETITLTPTLGITETPEITPTPTPIICDNLVFVSDATVPDGSTVTAGQEFVKTWRVRNTGSCTWSTGYHLILSYGDAIGGQTTYLSNEVLPNTEAEISVTLKAPTKPGTYIGVWILANNNFVNFGERLTVSIVVP